MNSFVTCDFFKDTVVLYALYVHCTHVRLSYVINFYLLTYFKYERKANLPKIPVQDKRFVKFHLQQNS